MDAEAEALVLWLPDAKNQLIGKYPDAGRNSRQKETGMAEDEMVRWYHWLNEHEFEQTLGDSGKQVSLTCCSLWGHRESDPIQGRNNSNSMLGLPGSGIEPMSPRWQADFLPLSHQGSPLWLILNSDSEVLLETNGSNPLALHTGETDAGEVEQWVQGHPTSCGPAPSSAQNQSLCSMWLLFYAPGRCSTSSGNFLIDILRKNKSQQAWMMPLKSCRLIRLGTIFSF